MINQIIIKNVASFGQEGVSIETDKKVNLIYGLNGSGKTTISNFLQAQSSPDLTENFSDCSIQGLDDTNQKILVYNGKFVEENFYQSATQPGIFTLSKGNKDAINKIEMAEKELKSLENQLHNEKTGYFQQHKWKKEEKDNNKKHAQDRTWQIKQDYTGGDRIFDEAGFLDRLKGKKEDLFQHIINIHSNKTAKTIENIRQELSEIKGTQEERESLKHLELDLTSVEENLLFKKEIVGNDNSSVAGLIKKLNNSDWVKQGLEEYVNLKEGSNCPFCQEQTLNEQLINNIKGYFDQSYQNDTAVIKRLKSQYADLTEGIKSTDYKKDFMTDEQKLSIEEKFRDLFRILEANRQQIENKINQFSRAVELDSSSHIIREINDYIDLINREIENFNQKIKAREQTIETLKNEFWQVLRKEYDQVITYYKAKERDLKTELTDIESNISSTNENIKKQKSIIAENQKKTTNIDETVDKINTHLKYFGIQDFSIVVHDREEKKYRIERDGQGEANFKTLSEGEKTVISFLYFVELCCGKETEDDTKEKIIVIDDPISSLSHMYVFNVASLIRQNFTSKDSDFIQSFVLTHNLYFFNELIDKNSFRGDDEEKKHQKLFRIIKRSTSEIKEMKPSEIQNEYQSYWQIIRDHDERSVYLVANAMRNIIEYFFGFVGKRQNLTEIFDKGALKENKYQFFKRYIDRESHSDPTNASYFKDFNYDLFNKAFELIFEESKYGEHYQEMMKK